MNAEESRVLQSVGGNFEEINTRALSAAVLLTFLTLTGFAGLVWMSALQSSVDGVTTSSGARAAIVALSACFSIAILVRSLTLWTPTWLPWVGVITTAGFLLAAALLFLTGNPDTAFGLYGGFQVPRAERLFSDSHIILSWFSCGFCSEWNPRYGPGLAALNPLTLSTIGITWLPFLGTALVVIALVSIYLLSRSSQPLGRWVLVVGALSPGWLLLVERANWDVLILGALILGALVVSVRANMITWTGFALVIWLLGAIKIYPFALGLVLLLALSVRFGWLVPTGFALATAVFVAMNFSTLMNSGNAFSDLSQLPYVDGSSPAYGRILLSARLDGLLTESSATVVTLISLLAILVFAAWWGWLAHVPGGCHETRLRLAILSLGGATAFLAKALVVGFGFAYAGAGLLLVVPAICLRLRHSSFGNGSMVALAMLVLVALFGSYNVVLGTLAGFVVAGFGLGFGARVVWETLGNRLTNESEPFPVGIGS